VSAKQLPRGRHKLSREEVVAAQRSRMITATAEAMAELGYVNTPVAEIIKRAGVSRETFYQQFSSKQDCFLAALEETLGGLSALFTSLPADGTPIERFDRLIGTYLNVLAHAPQFARLFLIEVYAAGPEVSQRRAELQQPFVDGLVELFGASSERGRFAVQALVAAIVSLVTSCLASGEASRLPGLREPLVGLVRAGLERYGQ
jgi:AcrR family transcriptional regulator